MQVQQNTSTLQCAGVSTRNSRKYESVYRFLDKKKEVRMDKRVRTDKD